MFLRWVSVAHGDAGGAPRDQHGGTGQKLGHETDARAHVTKVRAESHARTVGQWRRYWERGLDERDRRTISDTDTAMNQTLLVTKKSDLTMGCSWAPGNINCICWASMAAAVFCWIRLFLPFISSWVFRWGGGCRYLQLSRVQRP